MRKTVLIAVAVFALLCGAAGVLLDRWSPSAPPVPAVKEPDGSPLADRDPWRELPPTAVLPDLSRVDRRLVEPPGLRNPRYALLVFGPRAESRVWLLLDGETLYVDRDGNGDLTDAGEEFAPTERKEPRPDEHPSSREWTYGVGDLLGGAHTDLTLFRWQNQGEPAECIVSVKAGGVTLQKAGWGPLFAASRDAAPVIHFGGPLVARGLRGSTLRLGAEPRQLSLAVGTPGVGEHSFAFVAYETVPRAVRPVVEVAWPTAAGVRRERYELPKRC